MKHPRSFLVIVFLIWQVQSLGKGSVEKNVVIGMVSGLALVMDVHYPDEPNGYGIVHVSGSGWGRPLAYIAPQLSESQVDLWGVPLVKAGYTVFSLNHRATPRFQWPDPIHDVQRAVRFIRTHAEEYGINPERIGAVGGSSGGHLVTALGTFDGVGNADDPDLVNHASAKVQVVVARAAVVDMVKQEGEGTALLMGNSLGRNENSEEYHLRHKASPINHVSKDDGPILFISGDKDTSVPIEQSERMVEKLQAVGVESRLLVIPNARHGPTFPGAVNPPDYVGETIRWFDTHLKK